MALPVAQTGCNNIPCFGVSLWNVAAVGGAVLQPPPITLAFVSMELGGLLRGFGKCVGRIVGGKAVGRMLCAGAGQQSVLQNNLGAWRYLGVRPGFFHLHKRPPAQAHTVGPAALNSAPKPNKLALKSVSTILCPCSEGMINPVSETELSLWDREVEDST